MKTAYERVKLGELFDIGSSKRVFQSEWRTKGIPFYRAREIVKLAADGYVDNELFIDEELFTKYSCEYGQPQKGDIMVTGVGTLGVCYVVQENDRFYFKDGNILWFRQIHPDRVIPEYIVSAFDSDYIKDEIRKNSSGTTVGTFTIQTAKQLEVALPSIDEQIKIVAQLAKVSGLIAMRKKQLQKLDDLVKARFVEMFGDPDTNPIHWQESLLSDHLDVIGGYAFKSEGFAETGIPVLRIGNINSGHFLPVNMVYWHEDHSLQRYKMYPGDLVMSLTGTVGKDDYGNVCILGDDYNEYYLNQRNAKLHLKHTLNKRYLAEMLKFNEIKKRLTGISRGVRQANISNKDILSLVVPIPPIVYQNQFATFIEQTDTSKLTIQQSLDKLELMKKALMQKYFG